jgi:hypothetical protein
MLICTKKRCGACRKIKQTSCFSKDASKWDGLSTKCKQCYSEYYTDYASANGEKIKGKNAKYAEKNKSKRSAKGRIFRANNVELTMWEHARTRAAKNNLNFSISLSDIVIPDTCPYLEIPLAISQNGRWSDNSPTLDRIVPDRGYVPDNIQVISHLANRMKLKSDPSSLLIFARNVVKLHGGESNS